MREDRVRNLCFFITIISKIQKWPWTLLEPKQKKGSEALGLGLGLGNDDNDNKLGNDKDKELNQPSAFIPFTKAKGERSLLVTI
jgi:hypothetical protein